MNQSERTRRVRKVVECNQKSREVSVSSSVVSLGLSSAQQTKSYCYDRVSMWQYKNCMLCYVVR